MPKGIYKRTPEMMTGKNPNSGFQKGNKINLGKKHSKRTIEKRVSQFRGKDHWNWKNGIKKVRGYIYIFKPEHPFCDCKGYIFEHRLVIEKQIGRYLHRWEISHHIGKRDDNRPKKLMAFKNQAAHNKFHGSPNSVKPSEIIFDGRKLT